MLVTYGVNSMDEILSKSAKEYLIHMKKTLSFQLCIKNNFIKKNQMTIVHSLANICCFHFTHSLGFASQSVFVTELHSQHSQDMILPLELLPIPEDRM